MSTISDDLFARLDVVARKALADPYIWTGITPGNEVLAFVDERGRFMARIEGKPGFLDNRHEPIYWREDRAAVMVFTEGQGSPTTIRQPDPDEVEPFGPMGEFQVGDGFTSKPKP